MNTPISVHPPRAVEVLMDDGTWAHATVQAWARTGQEWQVLLHWRSVDRLRGYHKQLSARGWKKNEPVRVGHEEPILVRKLLSLRYGSHISDRRSPTPLAFMP
ncbi:hypothetical protein [Microbispora sp. NPDC049125]|uniref:hypothetical protein n=1 Tax=Microbispora sp. NPDC049125 TaxID=3154929 RepID=UPI0034656865